MQRATICAQRHADGAGCVPAQSVPMARCCPAHTVSMQMDDRETFEHLHYA